MEYGTVESKKNLTACDCTSLTATREQHNIIMAPSRGGENSRGCWILCCCCVHVPPRYAHCAVQGGVGGGDAVQLLIETQHAHTGGVDPAVPCQNIQARQEHENEMYYLFLESPMIAHTVSLFITLTDQYHAISLTTIQCSSSPKL